MPSSKDGDKETPPSCPLETDSEPSHHEERRRRRNTLCRSSYETTTPDGEATAEVWLKCGGGVDRGVCVDDG